MEWKSDYFWVKKWLLWSEIVQKWLFLSVWLLWSEIVKKWLFLSAKVIIMEWNSEKVTISECKSDYYGVK